jgi:hypothetical protein
MVCLMASPHLTILNLTFFLFRKFLYLDLCIVYVSTWSFNNSIIINACEGILRQALFFLLFLLHSFIDFFSDYLGLQAKRVNFITISSIIQGHGTLNAWLYMLYHTTFLNSSIAFNQSLLVFISAFLSLNFILMLSFRVWRCCLKNIAKSCFFEFWPKCDF